jgi:DNA repair exonuclease SbcCD ATPase subunit
MELDESITKRIAITNDIAAAQTVQEAIAMEMAELSKRISAEDINLVKLASARAQPVRNPNIENGNALRMQELMTIKWGLERRLSNMLTGAGKCDKCGTDVSETHVVTERFTIVAALEANGVNIASLGDEMAAIDKAAQDAHITNIDLKIKVASEARDDLAAKLQVADDSLMMSKVSITRLNTTDLEWSAIGTKIQMDILTLKMQSDANAQTIASLQIALDKDSELKKQIAEATEEADKLQHALDMARQESFYLEAIVRGMGDKGVKAHKFGAMIQTLNDLVAENIRVLTDGQVQVWFSPWREKANAKSGDDIVPEIQIFVKEGPKEQVELALYSGMERQQVVIAIIRAFNKLAILQGAGTNILFMDEMFGMFDEASAATAIKLMNQLKNSDWGTIVVVTHNPDIKQVLEYDQLWTAEKQNHITTLRRETK